MAKKQNHSLQSNSGELVIESFSYIEIVMGRHSILLKNHVFSPLSSSYFIKLWENLKFGHVQETHVTVFSANVNRLDPHIIPHRTFILEESRTYWKIVFSEHPWFYNCTKQLILKFHSILCGKLLQNWTKKLVKMTSSSLITFSILIQI